MHILLGVGGDDAFQALEETVERASAAGDELTVAVYGGVDPDEVRTRLRDRLAGTDIGVSIRQIEGDPGGRIVELAEREGIDRIVLPGGHRSPLGKIRMDSVSEFVLLNASTTVTLVR